MKFTLSWLKDHLDTDAAPSAIAEALTDLGLEVEVVSDPAARLAAFRLGRVEAAERHPDADRLRVCQVRTADGLKQIICGAPNAREGITVVVAEPGAYVPGIDTTIGVGRIRGVESHGMMCSERELELSDEHEGIIELPSGEVGETFAHWLAEHRPDRVDPVIEVGVTPNRPDALGVRGIARDLAARGVGTLRPWSVKPVAGTDPSPIGLSIDADTLGACPLFHGRVIRGVTNGASPAWMQARLRAIGLRPISALVDITNYVTFDLARPLHVFDAARVTGDLRVHRARGGETLEALDERTYTLAEGMILISDDAGPESLAGIMGGERTGVSDATTDVFLEAAYWDPVRTALTGRALRIHSDARHRFERGVDPAFTAEGFEHATRLILEICGGEASEPVVAGAVPETDRVYRFDPARVETLVGMAIPEDEQRRTLEALGFRLDGDRAHVPSWRPDVQGEADLVEEVARVASLSKLKGAPMPRPQPGVPARVLTPGQARERSARRTAAALGYDECVTYSFIDSASAAMFGGGLEAVRLDNPISSEMSHLRPSLLPGLLRAAARNRARGLADLALFECGPVFAGGEPGEQETVLTGLLTGATAPPDPHGSRRPVDVFDAKADAEAVLRAVGAPATAMILRDAPGWWHPGRSGRVGLGPKRTIALFGQLHPRVAEAFDLRGPAMVFTVFLEAVPLPKGGASRGALTLSDLQAVERDLAFVVDARTEAGALVAAAQGADRALIESVRVFDVFEGEAARVSLGDGRKSLALTVRLQPREATLTEAEIAAVVAKVIAKVQKATGGTLRA